VELVQTMRKISEVSLVRILTSPKVNNLTQKIQISLQNLGLEVRRKKVRVLWRRKSESCEDTHLPEGQQSKRPASELSSDSPVVSEKRGRVRSLSDSSSVEEPRVFPFDSPNEVSFLTLALQSTPKDSNLNATLHQRATPRVRKVKIAHPPYFSPKEIKAELCSQEIT